MLGIVFQITPEQLQQKKLQKQQATKRKAPEDNEAKRQRKEKYDEWKQHALNEDDSTKTAKSTRQLKLDELLGAKYEE
jgi:hypothetical protein